MKKLILFTMILFVFFGNAYSFDAVYIVMRETHVRPVGQLTGRIATLREGDIVFFEGRTTHPATNLYEVRVRTERGQIGWVNAEHVLLKGSDPLPASIAGRSWVPSYYQRFLTGYPKEALFEHEPFWRDEYAKLFDIFEAQWWERAGITRFLIRDNFVQVTRLYAIDFIHWVTISQKQDGDTIVLYVLCEAKSSSTPQNSFLMLFDVGKTYRLTLKMDGDYMDIFIDDDTESVVTLIGVDDFFRNSVRDFFRGETIDLSRIIWPRRADGSMDFPPQRVSSNAPAQQVAEEPEEPVEIADYFEDQESAIAQENVFVQQNDDASSMPLWVWLVIAGGVLAAGVVVVFVKRKR